jgi:hypothetical protein
MMSGHIDGLSEKTLETIGITVFVNKPLPFRALREAVLKLVRSTSVDQMAWCQQKGRLSAGFGGTRHQRSCEARLHDIACRSSNSQRASQRLCWHARCEQTDRSAL